MQTKKLEKSNTIDNTGIIPKQLLGRFGTVLSESQEQELKKYITDMDIAFYGLANYYGYQSASL